MYLKKSKKIFGGVIYQLKVDTFEQIFHLKVDTLK